jgi:hypothetical protein
MPRVEVRWGPQANFQGLVYAFCLAPRVPSARGDWKELDMLWTLGEVTGGKVLRSESGMLCCKRTGNIREACAELVVVGDKCAVSVWQEGKSYLFVGENKKPADDRMVDCRV